MARKSGIWQRKGRGYWTTIAGQQIPLGHDKKEATRAYHLRMSEATYAHVSAPELAAAANQASSKPANKGKFSGRPGR